MIAGVHVAAALGDDPLPLCVPAMGLKPYSKSMLLVRALIDMKDLARPMLQFIGFGIPVLGSEIWGI